MSDLHDFNESTKKKKRGGIVIAFIIVIIVSFTLGALTSAFFIIPGIEEKLQAENKSILEQVTEDKDDKSEKSSIETPKEDGVIEKKTDAEDSDEDSQTYRYENPVVEIVETIGSGVVSVRSESKAFPNIALDTESSFGSGFIISDEGYIVTNNHVIEDGKSFTVIMSDGEEHKAELIGGDSYRDIAVLKIEADNLTVVPVGDSEKVKVGQLAIAIGNPLGEGLGGTVTVGYISAVHRQVEGNEYLQTDAAINPGNSGGPLVNVDGEVIGINALKNYLAGIDEAGIPIATEGIGFAIPINEAVEVANELIETGEVKRSGIGIQFFPITEEMAKENDVPIGAYVAAVTQDGPADIAGVKEEDIIIGLNGKKIEDPEQLPDLVQALKIGDEAVFEIWREDEILDITIIIGNLSNMN